MKAFVRTLQIIYLIVGVITSSALLLCKDLIIFVYDVTSNAKALAG